MTISEIADKVEGKVLLDSNISINKFYCGDSLTRVMGKAPAKSGWLTVINNINVAGVAAVADIPLIILCEGVEPDEQLLFSLKQDGIALIITSLPIFEGCLRLKGAINAQSKSA